MKNKFKLIAALCLAVVMTVTVTLGVVPQTNALTYSGSTSYASGPYYTKLTQVTLTGDNRTDIVNVALSQVGYQEGNNTSQRAGTVQGSGNYTEYGRWYGMDGAYWCAMFVSWCAMAAGISSSVVLYHSYTETQLSWFKNRGQAYSWATVKNGGYNPQPGDIIFFVSASGAASGRNTNHIGIVKSYNRSSQKLITIEGNTSSTSFSTNGGCVAQKTYYHSSTYPVYICKPSYTSAPTYSTGVHEVTTTSGLNVRDAATTSGSNIIGSFTAGERFNCLEVVNEHWAKINYYGTTAYVSIKSDYVKKITGNTAFSNPTDLVFDTQSMADWAARTKDSASVVAYHTASDGALNARFCATASTNDPMVYLNFKDTASFKVDDYNYISIVAQTNVSKSAGLFLCAGSITSPTPDCYAGWQWEGDGMWREYIIDISQLSNFAGVLNEIRFDYIDETAGAGQGVNIRSIRFLKSKSSPKITASASVVSIDDQQSLKFTYSGMSSYSGGEGGMYPLITILPSWTCPGAGNNNRMLWNYIATSGEIYLSWEYLQVDSGFKDAFENYYDWKLPAGEYTAYLSYNTAGDDNFMHSVDLASAAASVTFTIVDNSLDVDITSGLATGNTIGIITEGTTAADAIESGATVKDASGKAVTGDVVLGTGMTITSEIDKGDGTTYTQTYTVVIEGDVTGDGDVTIDDVAAALDQVRNVSTLSAAGRDALALATGSTSVDILAVAALLNIIIGL